MPVDFRRLEARARKKMSRAGFAYVAGGAGAESTMAANREAFERWRIVPRLLKDVSARDLSIELFGRILTPNLVMAHRPEIFLAAAKLNAAVAASPVVDGSLKTMAFIRTAQMIGCPF